ncbi:hypothetical protein GCM10010095_62210 [Streptomyces anthocyanicus]|nr:hypothetical protein GCM10010095_62210 [Streptomyces anthocyanicus]
MVHQGRRITAGALRALVHRLAHALRAQGVERGQTVTLLSGNLPEALAARYAANLIGCPVTHLYNKLSADAQAAIVRDVETRALIVDPSYAARAAEATARAPVPHVLALGAGQTGTDLLELAAAEPAEPVSGLARPEDICSIRHTGGTTGHPKGICTSFERAGRMRPESGEDERPAGPGNYWQPPLRTPPDSSSTTCWPRAARWCCRTTSPPARCSPRSNASASPTSTSCRRCCTN